jgi:RNA polymerase sigma-70 factor (ECF subfamily)
MDLDAFVLDIQARDTVAFGRWMAGAEAPMRESLRSFAAHLDVEAVLQEALVRVWTVAPRFEPDGRPNGLLRFGVRIARNLAISELRRTRARPLADEDLEKVVEPIEPTTTDPLLRNVIERCREKLPEQPKRALDARVMGFADDDTLAKMLGMRLNTFLQNFGRARRMLAECLKKNGVTIDAELET